METNVYHIAIIDHGSDQSLAYDS